MKPLDCYWNNVNLVSLLLWPLSVLFCMISYIRKKLYSYGLFKSYKASVPVIIVGNISVGGTGKTPLIIELVKQLQKRGHKPAVISRGYGGNATRWPQIVNANTCAEQVGDEPQLIFQRTQCPVVVGANRQQDIETCLREFDCDIILSDDGLQHYALQRNVEIVVVDASRLFGNGFCIPAGPLREKTQRLSSVDLVLYNGGGDSQYSFSMGGCFGYSVGCAESKEINLEKFSGKTVHGIAGIGNPSRFFDMLEAMGIHVISHDFKDHHKYQPSELVFNDGLAVLMTEKDAVKCADFKLSNHWSIAIDIQLNAGAQAQINKLFKTLV